MNLKVICSHVVMFFALDCAKVGRRLSSYGLNFLRNRCVTWIILVFLMFWGILKCLVAFNVLKYHSAK
jgi:hypothetical protein